MPHPDLNRRDFNKLSMAALGGMMAGAMTGCGGGEEAAPPAAPSATTPPDDGPAATPEGDQTAAADNPLMNEPHVCRGLNTCQGKGAGGDNACAGQGACATAARHECAGMNECKGQGGCGENPGANSCKGEGSCAVPLMEEAWKTARENFEQAMQAAGNEVGAAPAAG